MLNLESFRPVELGNSACFMTLTLNSIIFSRGLMEKLRRPDFIRVSINEEQRLIIVSRTDGSDPFAVDLTRMPLRGRVNSRDFVKKLKLLSGFSENDTVKVPGQYIPENDLVLLNLNDSALADSDI